MTAQPVVRIPTPHEIATDPRYMSGTWRDAASGLNLPRFLAENLGGTEARRILDEAADIADGVRHPVVPARSAVPRPGHDRVWSHNGVDHDPIPLRQVTVCGLLIPPRPVYEPAGAEPCPDCFEGALR